MHCNGTDTRATSSASAENFRRDREFVFSDSKFPGHFSGKVKRSHHLQPYSRSSILFPSLQSDRGSLCIILNGRYRHRVVSHSNTTLRYTLLNSSRYTCVHLRRRITLHFVNVVCSDWIALHLGYISIRTARCVVCILFYWHWCLCHPCMLLLVRIELVRVLMLFRL